MCDALRKLVGTLVFLCGAFGIMLMPGGCTFQPIQATYFQVANLTPGTIAWSIPATFSPPAIATRSTDNWQNTGTLPQLAIQNLTGPPIYIEAIEIFRDGGGEPASYSIPIKLQATGVGAKTGPIDAGSVNNLIFSIPDISGAGGITDATRPPDTVNVPAAGGVSVRGIVLWRNSLGQRNYRGGTTFDASCFCYPPLVDDAGNIQATAAGVPLQDENTPTLVTANVAPEVTNHSVRISFNATYKVGAGN